MKAVVIHYDATSDKLCITSANNLQLPNGSLEMVRVQLSELDKLSPEEVHRRIAGTIIGALEVLHKRKILGV
jgi:hypothetical protein